MKHILLTSVAALTLGSGALAQNSFPDVPADSYAAEAVSQLVELGIVNGFPDGTFKGNDPFTRYQAALVVSRLLDVIEENSAAADALSEEDLATVNNAVAELQGDLTALSDRVAALEQGDSEALTALTDRLAALEATPQSDLADGFTALEGRVAALEETPAAGADVTALQEQVTALNDQVNELRAQLEGTTPAPAPEEPTTEEPEVDLTEPVAAPDMVAVTSERGKFYFGLAGAYEINAVDNLRFRPRVKLGVDDIVAGFGLRLAADYGRQSLIEEGSLAPSAHLTYSFGVPAVGAYLGVGGGYQLSETPLGNSGAVESPFAGALLGAEFGSGPITFFLEGTLDYYFNEIATEGYGTIDPHIYPTAALGFNIRP